MADRAGAEVDLGNLFRREAGKMTSALVRLFGVHNLPLVEDVVHDALCRALEVWKFTGVPDNPAAWLVAAAKNRAVDVLRRERTARTFAPDLKAVLATGWTLGPAVEGAFFDEAVKDEQLRMMFACCHPRLSEEVRIALVLNLLCGFGARGIAHAFLVSVAAIEKRLARGKEFLTASGSLPEITSERAAEQLPAIHRGLYLLFNEGYHGANATETIRTELCGEAIHLALLLATTEATALPGSLALLALMCLTAARLPARKGSDDELVPLEEQDRSAWDGDLVQRGIAALQAAATGDDLTTYHVEAAIAAEHALASAPEDTNWDRIITHYDLLLRLTPSPVIALNRAIAVGRRDGPERALAEIAAITDKDKLASYFFYPAAVAEEHLRAARPAEALAWFDRAIGLARSPAEERYLTRRRAIAAQRA